MNDNEKMKIRLTIADGIYPMTIDRKEEELYRKAATMINEKVNMYRERGSGGKREDYIIMVAFEFAFMLANKKWENDTLPYQKKLDELTRELEKRLDEESEDKEL